MRARHLEARVAQGMNDAFLIFRRFLSESPTSISIQRVGDSGSGNVVARAGEEVDLECAVSGGNPPSLIKWFAGDRVIESGHR